MDDIATFISHNCFWILVLVAFYIFVKSAIGGAKSAPEKPKPSLEDNAKRIREENRDRERRYERGEFDLACPICKARCKPLRNSLDEYDCAKCDKQFKGVRHSF